MLFLGCKTESEKTLLLTSDRCWSLILEGDISYKPHGHCYSFSSDNKYEEFYYDKEGVKRKYSYGDQKFTDDWDLKYDTVLQMSGFDYKIKYLSADSMVLSSPNEEIMKFISLIRK